MQPLLKKNDRPGIMFDTNIFNQILDDKISLNCLPKNVIYYVTFVQKGEIEQTSDGDRRNKLLQIFKQIKQKKISTETSLYGWGPYGEGKYGALGRLYPGILKTIKQLDKKARKKKKKENQKKDALIGETCIVNKLILISNDSNLREAMKNFGGVAISFKDFLSQKRSGG